MSGDQKEAAYERIWGFECWGDCSEKNSQAVVRLAWWIGLSDQKEQK